jgi:hypothetical protein
MNIVPYHPDQATAWDTLIRQSRNGTFLLERGFLGYHAHRFEECSLLVQDDKGQLQAVFPATRHGDEVISHGGMTYGGLILSPRLTQAAVLEVFAQLGAHYAAAGCVRLLYKAVPHIFHRFPAEDDLYALHRLGARLVRRDASSAVALQEAYAFTKGRNWSVNKARKAGLTVRRNPDPAAFHQLLTAVLARHGAAPVHSLDDMRLLMARFPERVVLYEAVRDEELCAGVWLFDKGSAVHTQYMAASEAGRDCGALDFLVAELMRVLYADRRYFSFGISTEQAGQYLNEGLIAQKEGFGARTVVHDFYEWNL